MTTSDTPESAARLPTDPSSEEGLRRPFSLWNAIQQMTGRIAEIIAVFNLVVTVSLLIAVVSFWLDFRSSYTVTAEALINLSPVGAGLLPSILVGITTFSVVWLLLSGWHRLKNMRTALLSDRDRKSRLKNLAPDIECCLYFLGEYIKGENHGARDLLKSYISDSCDSLWDDLHDLRINGPTVYNLSLNVMEHPDQEICPEELQRLLGKLLPLAKRGDVRGAGRVY